MIFSMIRCRLGSWMKGEPISDPAVFSTTMRISWRIDRVDESPIYTAEPVSQIGSHDDN